jgi:hypothetical protein
LLEAAEDGRADDIIALLAEGADIEWKDEVRRFNVLIACLSQLQAMIQDLSA